MDSEAVDGGAGMVKLWMVELWMVELWMVALY